MNSIFFNCFSFHQNKENYLSKSFKKSPSLVEDNAKADQEAKGHFSSVKDCILHRLNLMSSLISADFTTC